MESKIRHNKGTKNRKRSRRVLRIAGKGRTRLSNNKITKLIKHTTKDWELYEDRFITKHEEGPFILKVQDLAHDETMQTKIWVQHGNSVALIQVFGRSKKHNRERLLGYILTYTGNPTIHAHTWYVGLAYSDEDDVRRKEPQPIRGDDNVRLYAAGMGVFDYLFCYKAKTKEHDEAGFSDGSTHLETAGQWKDGIY